MTRKFVDDTALTEIVAKSDPSRMQANCEELAQQANVNGHKTKEMLIGTITKDPPPSLSLCGATVDRPKIK